MPSFMDQAMDGWKPPTSDDLEISLPPRREPKKELASDDVRESGQHGGGADGTAADAHSDTAATAEPTPQRDEPDEGEHTDSTQEQVAARQPAPIEEQRPVADEPEVREDAVSDEDLVAPPAVFASEPPAPAPVDLHETLSAIVGSAPREFKRIGFNAGEAKTVLVKKFPQPLVDRLRVLLAVGVGGDFAEQISAPAIISAYLVATTGVELDLDENTAIAAEAFRTNEPRLASVEDRLEQMVAGVDRLADAMQLGLKRISETGHTVDAMEFATAYLVADRVAGIATVDTNETNVDVTDKKALAARERIRSRTKEHRTIETQREGRRLA